MIAIGQQPNPLQDKAMQVSESLYATNDTASLLKRMRDNGASAKILNRYGLRKWEADDVERLDQLGITEEERIVLRRDVDAYKARQEFYNLYGYMPKTVVPKVPESAINNILEGKNKKDGPDKQANTAGEGAEKDGQDEKDSKVG